MHYICANFVINCCFIYTNIYYCANQIHTLKCKTDQYTMLFVSYQFHLGQVWWHKLQRCGHDRMSVGFTITYAINAYHQFECRSGKLYSIQHYVIKFVSDVWQVSGFLHQENWPPWYTGNWNIVESGIKHENQTKHTL